jgi:hypothetical protein
MRAIIRACQANYSEYSRLSKDGLAFKLVGKRPGSSSSASLSKKERTVQLNPKIGASLVYSGPPDAPSGPQRRPSGLGLVEPLPPAARARHLLEEAKAASLEHLRELQSAVATVRDLADEVVGGGDLYAPGLHELAKTLSEDLFWKSKTLELLSQRQSERRRALA